MLTDAESHAFVENFPTTLADVPEGTRTIIVDDDATLVYLLDWDGNSWWNEYDGSGKYWGHLFATNLDSTDEVVLSVFDKIRL